jgi:hypothetical protein
MSGLLKALAGAAILAVTASLAGAAPVTNPGGLAQEAGGDVIRVHGYHRSCERDRRGWHRHSEWGERRRCRTWSGRGRRPDFCVRVGPIWVCDY